MSREQVAQCLGVRVVRRAPAVCERDRGSRCGSVTGLLAVDVAGVLEFAQVGDDRATRCPAWCRLIARPPSPPIHSDKGTLPVSEVSSLISELCQASGGPSEGVGGTAAVLVLLNSFGSLLAMGLPMVTALFGIGTGLAGIFLRDTPCLRPRWRLSSPA